MILELIKILLISLFGLNNGPKYDLRKKEKVSFSDSIEMWLLGHGHIIIPLLIMLLVLLIIALVATFVAHVGANVTMVESGNWYNHMQDVV